MEQLVTKYGVDVNKKISNILQTLYLRLGHNEGNQDVICGEILAYTELLKMMGYYPHLTIEIRESKD